MNTSIALKWLLPFAFALIGVTTLSEVASLFDYESRPVPSIGYQLDRYERAVAEADSLSRMLDSLLRRTKAGFEACEPIEHRIAIRLKRIGEKRRRPVESSSNHYTIPEAIFPVKFTSGQIKD